MHSNVEELSPNELELIKTGFNNLYHLYEEKKISIYDVSVFMSTYFGLKPSGEISIVADSLDEAEKLSQPFETIIQKLEWKKLTFTVKHPNKTQKVIVFSPDTKRNITEKMFREREHEKIGTFFGYPEDAIKFMLNSTYSSQDFTNWVINETNLTIEDLKYLGFIYYVPNTTRESVMNSINTGKKREKTLRQFDSTLEWEMIGRTVKKVLENERNVWEWKIDTSERETGSNNFLVDSHNQT